MQVPGASLRTAPYSVKGAREQGRVRERGVSHGKIRKAGMMNGENEKGTTPLY